MNEGKILQKWYDVVVLGASVFGCGYAIERGKDCLLLEKSMLIGSEFTTVYRCHSAPDVVARSNKGQWLMNQIQQRNLISDCGELSVPPISGILSKGLLETKVDLLLMSRVSSIVPIEDGYKISFFGINGWEWVTCGSILDTTSLGMCHTKGNEYTAKKYLCAMLCQENKNQADNGNPWGLPVRKGRFEDELILTVFAAQDTGLTQAREQLIKLWEARRENTFVGWKIAAVAERFDYVYERPIKERVAKGFVWIPSCAYQSLPEAFEGGVQCATLH